MRKKKKIYAVKKKSYGKAQTQIEMRIQCLEEALYLDDKIC